MTDRNGAAQRPGRLGLTLLAFGVVYGDIGTSPIYTIGLFFEEGTSFLATKDDILGLLSLVFWVLTSVVTIEYVTVILRFDNRGEGGILALLALALRAVRGKPRRRRLVVVVGLLGASLFFADIVVTPAISVLSAVEGLEVAAPSTAPYVVPLAALILTALFAIQSRGTARVGVVFGPVIVVWFVVLTVLGLRAIIAEPLVLAALNPLHAARFFANHGLIGFLALGIVVLAVTGAEALYADLGHFGRAPIRLGWLGLAYPALTVNYFGQGALILGDPSAADHPFFLLAPDWGLYPLIALSTAATVIAAQATISGAFSIAAQAVQLGYLPRLRVVHTSERMMGQIYAPRVNSIMLVLVLALVFWFGSSSGIAAVYGVAVTGTFVSTFTLAAIVFAHRSRIPLWAAVAAFGVFIFVDGALFLATSTKLASGAFMPLVLAALIYAVMSTWKKGRVHLERKESESQIAIETFLERVTGDRPPRVGGTAIYLTSDTDGIPQALLHNLKHNKVLHERIVLLSVDTVDEPRVEATDRLVVTPLGKRFYRVALRFGFFETPDLPGALKLAAAKGLDIDLMDTSFFLGRRKIVRGPGPPLSGWRERLFIALGRNAQSATDYFHLPPNRVVELGAVVEI